MAVRILGQRQRTNPHQGRRDTQGAALVELALVVPLLLLFMFGIFQLGYMLTQVFWAMNASYSGAMSGSSKALAERKANMEGTTLQYANWVDPGPDDNHGRVKSHYSEGVEDNGNGTTSINFSGPVRDAFNMFFLSSNITSRYVGPVINKNASSIVDLTLWGNAPDDSYRSCTGANSSTPYTATCVGDSGITGNLFP